MWTSMNRSVFLVLLVSILLYLTYPKGKGEIDTSVDDSSSHLSVPSNAFQSQRIALFQESKQRTDLEYDFYRLKCPQAESIVRSTMNRIFTQHNDAPAAILRLFFHDCFIQGCDASILVDDSHGDKSHLIERQALPSQTLKGFDKIDIVKEEVEKVCPGVVSCADILALATREGIVLEGGPFYPVPTGRRDSARSFHDEAMAEIPNPADNITKTLNLFASRGFNERETVTLLGAHNIGKIGCNFIRDRLDNFSGTGMPDPTMDSGFLNEMRTSCNNTSRRIGSGLDESSIGAAPSPEPLLVFSGTTFDGHYYQSLLRGRGLLFSDQQLMAQNSTAKVVSDYASDDGETFRRAFAAAMMKMSRLNPLTGSQGQVRQNCSLPIASSTIQRPPPSASTPALRPFDFGPLSCLFITLLSLARHGLMLDC